MAIPDFQSIMLPVLDCLKSGEVVNAREIRVDIANHFSLSEEDIQQRLPSGKQTVINNRVGWAITYMKKAGLLDSAGKAQYQITDEGKSVLVTHPERIDVKYLKQLSDEFKEFHQAKPTDKIQEQGLANIAFNTDTPDEILEKSYTEINVNLASELLQMVREQSPQSFESTVVDLLLAMGYGGWSDQAGQVTQYSADGGIDGIINEDPLGLEIIYLQAKRYKEGNTVGRPDVQAFVGALEMKRARKGVFITTSSFTREALEYVSLIDKKVILIGGQQLAEYMVQYNLGVSIKKSYQLKAIDSDYFNED
jgi:restriction system protein